MIERLKAKRRETELRKRKSAQRTARKGEAQETGGRDAGTSGAAASVGVDGVMRCGTFRWRATERRQLQESVKRSCAAIDRELGTVL